MKQIWFLTGSQDLYGPETLEQVAVQSKEVVAKISQGVNAPVEIIWKPTLKNTADIKQAMLDASSDPQCVGVITWMHTFSPAKMWIQGLDLLRKPLLHLHTQANQSLQLLNQMKRYQTFLLHMQYGSQSQLWKLALNPGCLQAGLTTRC